MRSKRMLAAVLDGIALPGTMADERHRFARLANGSDLSRLRSDMLRISASFKTVMARNGNSKATTCADAKDSAFR